jgi:glycosyltransferase involved in cell wall biosynthesis
VNNVRVAICIGTYKRLPLLDSLLSAIARLQFRRVRRPALTVIVVDNDSAQSARPVCRRHEFPWALRYVCEPNRGIAAVRNRAIAEAEGADFLAFIDDDEAPAPHWLDELLHTQSQFRADVVSGSVLPCFPPEVPSWVRSGGFFSRPIRATGRPVELCSTNNALLRADTLRSVSHFDEQFNLTGGEDTHFFLRIRSLGFRMIAARDAVVYEVIPVERAQSGWILRRGYQAGNSWSLCERDLDPRLRVALARIAKAAVHLLAGLLLLLPSLLLGKARRVSALRRIYFGAGMITGVFGHRFLPYRDSGEAPLPNQAGAAAGG